MRSCLIACLALIGATGCTNHYLRHSVVKQAGTLTELEYQQVLGNLAMLSLDPWALPTHASLKDGSAQVQDVGLANLVAFTNGSQTLPGLTGSRTLVEQWSVVPVTEKDGLLLLRVAYRHALGLGDRLEHDFANDLAHDLCEQIGNSDDFNELSDPSSGQSLLRDLATLRADLSKSDFVALDQIIRDPTTTDPDRQQAAVFDARFQRLYAGSLDEATTALARSQIVNRLTANEKELVTHDDLIRQPDPDEPYPNRTIVPVRNQDLHPAKPPVDPNHPNDRDPDRERVLHKLVTPVTREARRQILEVTKDIDEIPVGWFSVGCKKDIPPDACYVGRFRDRYAWVCPGPGTKDLADFTATILDFSTLLKERNVTTVTGGPRYTPEGNR